MVCFERKKQNVPNSNPQTLIESICKKPQVSKCLKSLKCPTRYHILDFFFNFYLFQSPWTDEMLFCSATDNFHTLSFFLKSTKFSNLAKSKFLGLRNFSKYSFSVHFKKKHFFSRIAPPRQSVFICHISYDIMSVKKKIHKEIYLIK